MWLGKKNTLEETGPHVPFLHFIGGETSGGAGLPVEFSDGLNTAETHNHFSLRCEILRESTGSGLASGFRTDMKTNQERGRSVRPRPAAEEAADPGSRSKFEENFLFGKKGKMGLVQGSRFTVHS